LCNPLTVFSNTSNFEKNSTIPIFCSPIYIIYAPIYNTYALYYNRYAHNYNISANYFNISALFYVLYGIYYIVYGIIYILYDSIDIYNDLGSEFDDNVLYLHDIIVSFRIKTCKTPIITMLHFNFTRLFRAKGIHTPSKYLVQHGFSDKFATRVVRNDFRKLNIDDVEKLCEIFLCTPNDLLQWVPDSKTSDPSTHPLAPLMRDEKVMDLTRTLNSVPFERLLEIEKLIQEEVNKD